MKQRKTYGRCVAHLEHQHLRPVQLKNCHCATFAELVSAVRGTIDYDSIYNCYLDHRADKLWALARDDVAPPDSHVDLMTAIDALPDDLANTLTPQQTLGLFNAWYSEQQIDAYKIAWFLISRLQGRVYKRIVKLPLKL